MCVVSMVMDHYRDKWGTPNWALQFPSQTAPVLPQISPQEVEEFRRLLERAREYDKRNNEPDCEMASKKREILDLVEKHGIKIDFL